MTLPLIASQASCDPGTLENTQSENTTNRKILALIDKTNRNTLLAPHFFNFEHSDKGN